MTGIDLFNPHIGLPVGIVLLTAYLLGIVHGVTPDEHTWPITFSYAIGSYSSKKGLIVGLVFSGAFSIQRAIASELAYLAFGKLFSFAGVDYVVYVVVGLAMAAAGAYVMRVRTVFHLHLRSRNRGSHREVAGGSGGEAMRAPNPWMAAGHGFIAGWGFGAFAVIVYTVLAPSMPGPAFAWLPGMVFGLGTMTVQAGAGALFGYASRRMKLPPESASRIAVATAGRTLLWGGLVFVAGGIFGLLAPGLAAAAVPTGIRIHNLAHVGMPLVLVSLTVLVIGMGSLVGQTRREAAKVREAAEA